MRLTSKRSKVVVAGIAAAIVISSAGVASAQGRHHRWSHRHHGATTTTSVRPTTSTTLDSTTTVPRTTSTTAKPVTTTTTVRPTTTTTSRPTTTTVVASPSLAGWQLSAANTGLASVGLSCANLPLYSGPSYVPAGTTISGVRVTDGLVLTEGNIKIDRTCFQPTSAGLGLPIVTTTDNNTITFAKGAVTISNSDFDGTKLTVQQAAYATAFSGVATMQNNYVHHFGSGIALMNTGTSLSSEISHNYVTDLMAYGDGATTGNHSDGFTVRDFDATKTAGRKLLITNNRFDCDSGNDTGALFIQTYAGRIDNVTVTGNLLEGSGYQLGLNQLNAPYSNMAASNNRFSNTGWGSAYVQGGVGWTSWTENYVNDPSAADNKGTAVAKP